MSWTAAHDLPQRKWRRGVRFAGRGSCSCAPPVHTPAARPPCRPHSPASVPSAGVGGDYEGRSLPLLRRGGMFVSLRAGDSMAAIALATLKGCACVAARG